MVYMAGDNGLMFDTPHGQLQLMAAMAEAGYSDLAEMCTVGTTDRVAIVCLFDTPGATYIIEVRKGKGLAGSLVRQIPAANTGSPDTLRWFITESMQTYPADHNGLVIWNHGTGWPDVDYYAPVRAAGYRVARPPIFRTTLAKAAGSGSTRPIAYDDSSKDFLDSRDLHEALLEAQTATGTRLDLIGMDACLMAMVEGARELAPFASYFVASQEVEPMSGWPYNLIAAALDGHPETSPGDLASLIVHAYAQSYGGATREQTVTQSAIVLERTAETEALCKQLVESILATNAAGLKPVVAAARDRSVTFQDSTFHDLGDFAARLCDATAWLEYPAVTAAAAALRDHLQKRGADAPVLLVGYLPLYERATGLSVYLPRSARDYVPDAYRHLAFAQATGWDKLLDWLLAS